MQATRTRLGLRIQTTTAKTLMPNTQQWNVPGAIDIADTDKFSGSQGPNLGQDRTFTWALIKTKLTAFFAASFSGLQAQINMLAVPATYVPPVVLESVSGNAPGWYESGQVVSGDLSASLTVNDSGGPATGNALTILQGGTEVSYVSPYAFSFQESDSQSITLQATIAYLTGAVKNNSIGLPSPAGQIQAGTAQGAINVWKWTYPIFYGPSANVAANVNNIRTAGLVNALSGQVGATGQLTIETGTSYNVMLVVLPPGYVIASVTDLDALGADVTSEYEQAALGAEPTDANGTTYSTNNVYQFTQQVPYTTSHRHLVTLAAGNLEPID